MKKKSFSRLMSLTLSAALAFTSAVTGGPALEVKAAPLANKLSFTFQGGTGTDALPGDAPTKASVNLVAEGHAASSLAGLYSITPGDAVGGYYDGTPAKNQYWSLSGGVYTAEEVLAIGQDLSDYMTLSGSTYAVQTGYYDATKTGNSYYAKPTGAVSADTQAAWAQATDLGGSYNFSLGSAITGDDAVAPVDNATYFTWDEGTKTITPFPTQDVTDVRGKYQITIPEQAVAAGTYYNGSGAGTYWTAGDAGDYTQISDLVVGEDLSDYMTTSDNGATYIIASGTYDASKTGNTYYAVPTAAVAADVQATWDKSADMSAVYDFDKGTALSDGSYVSGTYYVYDSTEGTLTPKTGLVPATSGNEDQENIELPEVPAKEGYTGKWTFADGEIEGITWNETTQKISFTGRFLDSKYETGYEAVFTAKYTLIPTGFTLENPTVANFGDAFGNKTPGDIQGTLDIDDGVGSEPGTIIGTLYETTFTKGFGSPMSTGYYLSFKVDTTGEAPESLVASFEKNGEASGIAADLTDDPDKTALLFIGNKDAGTLVVTATYADADPIVKKYDLSGLILDDFEADANITVAEEGYFYGKDLSDIQDSVSVSNTAITGTLKYIDGGWNAGTWGEDMSSGHYLALHVSGAATSTKIISKSGPKYTVDPTDGLILIYMGDALTDDATLTLERTYADNSVVKREYDVSGLVLEPAPITDVAVVPFTSEEQSTFNLYGLHPEDLGPVTVTSEGNVNKIAANLNYVEDYTGFSSVEAEQSGFYLAFKASMDFVPEGSKLMVKVSKADPTQGWNDPIDLTSDGYLVLLVNNTISTRKLVVYAQKGTEVLVQKEYDLSDVVCLDDPYVFASVFPETEKVYGKDAKDLGTFTIDPFIPGTESEEPHPGRFIGTLNYVDDYEGFSGVAAEQSGHYLAFKVGSSVEGAEISAKLFNLETSAINGPYDIDDGYLVLIVSENISDKMLELTATKNGEVVAESYYYLEGIELEAPFTVAPVDSKTPTKNLYGKKASDLQSMMNLSAGQFTGNLNYVDGGWDASAGWGDLASGYFFAFRAAPLDDNWTISATIQNRDGTGTPAPQGDLKKEDDYVHVTAVSETIKNKELIITATSKAGAKVSKAYSLAGITVAPMFTVVPVDSKNATTTQLLGKTAADLQTNMTVGTAKGFDGKFTGTLKYVKDYTGFDATLKDGHYFAYKVNAPAGSTVNVRLLEGSEEKYKATLDEDMINILIVSESISKRVLEVTVKKGAYPAVTKRYDLSGITLEAPFTVAPVTESENDYLYGQKAKDLQTSMKLAALTGEYAGKFTGNLKFVESGWNDKAGWGDLASGYFFAFKAAPVDKNWTISASFKNKDGSGTPADQGDLLEKDGYVHVTAVSETIKSKVLVITATATSGAKVSRAYDLSGITVEELFSVVPVTDKDKANLYGKKASDLQTSMTVEASENYAGKFTGTLKYVDGTGWDASAGWGDMSAGHFFAFKVNADAGSTVTAAVYNGETKITDDMPLAAKDNFVHVMFVNDNIKNRILEVTVTRGTKKISRKYDLSGIKLQDTFTVSPVTAADNEFLYGKKYSDLQLGMALRASDDYDGKFVGTLKYVDGGWKAGTWGADMSAGYYFAFKAVPNDNVKNATVKVKIVNEDAHTETEEIALKAEDNYVHVVYVSNDLYNRTLVVTATTPGGGMVTRSFDLSEVGKEDLADRIIVTTPTITDSNFGGAAPDKKISELQRGITISDYGYGGEINGALKQVDDWQAWGTGINSGHYLALKVTAPGATKLEVGVTPNDYGLATLAKDGDHTAIMRIKNKDEQTVHIQATYPGLDYPVIKTFSIRNLILEGFELDTNIDANYDLLGKKVGDLQEGVVIDNKGGYEDYVGYYGGRITGALKYVTDYTGFDATLKEGHYVALHTNFNTGEKYSIINSTEQEWPIDPADGIVILHVANDSPVIRLVKTYPDGATETRSYKCDFDRALKDPVTVTFKGNYPELPDVIDIQTIEKNSLAEYFNPENILDSRSAVFGGWYTDEACTAGKEFNFAKPVEASTTVYAKWSYRTYTVRFNGKGGTDYKGREQYTQFDDTNNFTYSWPQSLAPNDFTNAGYEFAGWSLNPAADVVHYTNNQTVKNLTGDPAAIGTVVDLYAVWVAKQGTWTASWDWTNILRPVLTLTGNNGAVLKFTTDATVSSNGNTYYAEFTYNGVKYTDSIMYVNGDVSTRDGFSYTGVSLWGYEYTGKAIKIDSLKVYWGDSILVEGTDYTLKYKNNVNVGTATVSIIGKGQYDKAFNQDVKFEIYAADISTAAFSADDVTVFVGAKITAPKLLRGKSTINKKLYTVEIDGLKVGEKATAANAETREFTGTIRAIDGGNFTGEREFTVRVLDKTKAMAANKLSIKFGKLDAITQEQVDDPEGYVPTFTVGKEKLASTAEGFDEKFIVEYKNNHDAGTATLILTAADGCKVDGKDVYGTVKKTFNIPGKKFDRTQKAAFNVIKNKSVPYTGYAYDLDDVLETLEVADYAPGLERERDWAVSGYAKNVKKGTMSITIIGRGIYKDTVKVPVKIAGFTDYTVSFDGLVDANPNPEDISGENAWAINGVPYKAGGTTVTGLVVRALDGDYFLREGVDYTVSYENNKMLWSSAKNKKKYAQLVIKGKGNYGTKKIPFSVISNELTEYTVYSVPTEITSTKIQSTLEAIAKGKGKVPVIYDAVTGKKLANKKDFTFRYGVYDAETKTIPVTIIGIDNGADTTFIGEVELVGYHVQGAKLNGGGKTPNIAIKNPNTTFYYTGKAITLDADDFDTSGGKAVLGEDFEIVGYKNNIKAGTASVTVKAISPDYSGTTTLKFKINKVTKKAQN